MAKTWGHGLKAFAGGFQTGLSLRMERAKIDALKEEQKRLEEAQKEAERVFQEWYDSPSTKEFCANLDTASQGERAYFITGISRIREDVFKYFTEIDNDIREGNIAEAKSKNDLLEQKIKSATDLAKLGMVATFPDGSPMKISPEDIEFQKQIQIGKMAGGPTGEAMGMGMWKRRGLEEITPTPEVPTIKDYSDAWNYLDRYKDVTPETFNKVKPGFQKQFPNINMTDITQEALKSGVKPEEEPTPIAFKTLQDIKDSFKNVKTRARYDEAMASYNDSKEAKASDWTPPAFEDSLTDLIKKVESAFWADFVNKDGKLKDRKEAELYNKRVQQYLALIEEAKSAGIDVSQFQAFIPYKETWRGLGNPLVTSESW